MSRFIQKLSENSVVLFGNYTLLLFLLVHFFVIPFFPLEWHKTMFSVVITLIYLNLVVVIHEYRKSLLSVVVILILLDLIFTFLDLNILALISSFLNIALFVLVVVQFLIVIARSKKVNISIILDAVNGYLLLGVLCSMMIKVLVNLEPNSFAFYEAGIIQDVFSRNSEFQYYGLVTLTTLGYGEILPISPGARSVASFIAVAGQLYVAIIIALLVGKFAGQSKNENE